MDRTRPYLIGVLALAVLGISGYLHWEFFRISVRYLPTNTDEALNMLMARDIAAGRFTLLFWTQPYQFPLEAYILSLFVGFLPADAFGARIVLAVISCMSLLGFCWVALRSDSFKNVWPAMLLTLLPSAYLVTRQVGYLIPQYASTITFGWLLPLLFLYARKRPSWHRALALGITAGLALSVHLLSLGIVVMVAIAFCWGRNFKSALRNTAIFMPGMLLGGIPYILAMRLPEAYGSVTDTVGFGEAWARLFDPIATRIMPVALGIAAIDFPDYGRGLGAFNSWIMPFVYFFAAALLMATFIRLKRIAVAVLQRRWPVLDLHDIFCGTLWMILILASMAEFGIKVRYVLPLAFYFPFLLSYLYSCFRSKLWRVPMAVVIVLLALVNIQNTRRVMSAWSHESFAHSTPALPPLGPLIDHLNNKGAVHGYAPWWLSYRIPYETSGRINVAQPFNERFPGWPLPASKLLADQHPESPYIFQITSRRTFDKKFGENLAAHQMGYELTTLDSFEIYDRFHHLDGVTPELIPSDAFTLVTRHNPESAGQMLDRDTATYWSNDGEPQASIQVNFKHPWKVNMLRLYLVGKGYVEDSRHLSLVAFNGLSETVLFPEIEGLPKHVVQVRRHGLSELIKVAASPDLAGHNRIEVIFGFAPTPMDALSIRVVEPSRSGSPWAIAELEVFGEPSNPQRDVPETKQP